MSQELKNEKKDWRPSATINVLQKRAEFLRKIREFFYERKILEVETPLLSSAIVTEIHLASFKTYYQANSVSAKRAYFLQTSPEYAMKRLLAADSGAIFQLCKAFRNQEELGRQHNPEFTMLEWYRPGFGLQELMAEMDEFLQCMLNCPSAKRITYREVFLQTLNLDPFNSSLEALKQCAEVHGIEVNFDSLDKDLWLQLLMTHRIEPLLGIDEPCFIYDYPPSQAALARIRHVEPPVAERFEVYIKGNELANGFHELQDPNEQRKRFQNDLQYREQQQMELGPIDENFLAALEAGLPRCSGVALGVDRLFMLAMGLNSIEDAISFSFAIV